MKYLDTPIIRIKNEEAIVIARLNGQIVHGNKEAIDLYQYQSLHEFKELMLKDLMPDDFIPFYPEEMTPEHINFDGYHTHVCKRKNGDLFACKLHTHYQDIKNDKYLVGHLYEIREKVDLEKLRLQQIIKVLKRELEAERNKNTHKNLQQTSLQISKCYPELNSHDLKICYYITKHFNSKQISNELNITTDGVYAARKRIRKKLQLKPEEDLTKALVKCLKYC